MKTARNEGSWIPKLNQKWTMILIAAGAVFIAYRIGQARARKQAQAVLRKQSMTGSPTLQQAANQQANWERTAQGMGAYNGRDAMGFQNLGDLSCGNKPCAECARKGCQQPAVAQAEIPSEEFEFMS